MNKKSIRILLAMAFVFLSMQLVPFGVTNANTNQSTTKNTLIVALNSQVKDYNPVISNSAYDRYTSSSTYLGLGLLTTPNGDPTFTQWQLFPMLAKSWTPTPDGLNWTVTLNSGLTWQDGSPLTSTDVQYGLNATLDVNTGSPFTGGYLDLFNNTAFSSPSTAAVQAHALTIINATTFVLHFARFDPYQAANVAGIVPMPYHIADKLGNFSTWSTNDYDSGKQMIIGDGPYQLMNKSSDGNTVYLQAWSGWTSSYASKFAATGSYASKVPSIKNIIITVNNDPASAVTALKTGQIDYIDSQTALNTVFNQITDPAKAISYPAYGVQEMGLNMRSDVFGFNPADPMKAYTGEAQAFCSSISDASCTNSTAPTLAGNAKMFMQELQGTVYNQQGKGTNIDEFFYLTLNATQRQWIRQAFDFSVARQSIIDSLLGGHGYQILTRLLPQTGLVNTSLTPRPYNLTMALQLLTQTFGYKYDNSGTDNPNTTWVDESLPYFKVTFMVPNNNPNRVQWASRIAAALTSVGIDITIKSVTFPTALDRVFLNKLKANDGQYGLDYDHGGFDVYFAGWGGGPVPTSDGQFYSDKYFAPAGNNYQFLNSSYMNNLVNIEDSSTNATARNQAYYQGQTFIYQQALISMINQPQEIFAMNKYVQGFNPFDASAGAPWYANFTYVIPTSTITTTTSSGAGTSSSSGSASPFGDLYTIFGALFIGTTVVYFQRKRKMN